MKSTGTEVNFKLIFKGRPKAAKMICKWFHVWRHICGLENRRQSTLSDTVNSPKSGDDRIGQVVGLRHRGLNRDLPEIRTDGRS